MDCAAIIAAGEILRRAWMAARRDSDFLGLALQAANMNTFDIDLRCQFFEGAASGAPGSSAKSRRLSD